MKIRIKFNILKMCENFSFPNQTFQCNFNKSEKIPAKQRTASLTRSFSNKRRWRECVRSGTFKEQLKTRTLSDFKWNLSGVCDLFKLLSSEWELLEKSEPLFHPIGNTNANDGAKNFINCTNWKKKLSTTFLQNVLLNFPNVHSIILYASHCKAHSPNWHMKLRKQMDSNEEQHCWTFNSITDLWRDLSGA